MTDFVISATDLPTLKAAAIVLGFWDSTNAVFITQGPVPGDLNPMASYFLNVVGTVPEAGGYWARIRINGDNPFASGLLTIPSSLTVYSLMQDATGAAFWTTDGVTPAPDYVTEIGLIA